MKKLIFSVALLSAALSASAEEHPLWMRYPAISPDGTTIAFAYKGDLYSVSVNGGEARQLTTHAAFDSHPVWSPDSKKIAFTKRLTLRILSSVIFKHANFSSMKFHTLCFIELKMLMSNIHTTEFLIIGNAIKAGVRAQITNDQ